VRCSYAEDSELKSGRYDDNDADCERSQRLLVLHSAIRGQQYVEAILSTTQKLAILVGAPPFFLNGTNLEVGQFAPEQARQVLVEENALHAIFASSALLASSRNAKTCSRLTPG